ncbi:MAG: efflux RND transporter periplasmic adaptor subunit [Tannerellaceae bacterium]|jgi:RND family efflux transporter MFP subunit|nr:efflux RND transporter periplasmic adaptor subunit [Tannerellaceae bacterium]
MKTNVITPILITIATTGAIAWKLADNKKEIDHKAELSLLVNTVIPVTVEKPGNIPVSNQFRANGRIEAGNEVTIYSKAQAVVVKKYKKAGDTVTKGTLIAQLENSVIKENLRIAEMDYAKAGKDVERFQNLAAADAVTTRELEENQLVCRSAESRIAELTDQLANTTILSPVNGMIDEDFFEEGTLLSPGNPVADIVDGHSLKMKIHVTEKEVLRLHKGDKATITTDLYPDKPFIGVVDVIAPKGNNLYSYPVELTLNSNKDLKPGMYAAAVFDPEETDTNTIVVSRKAITGGMKAPFVYVVRDDRAYKTPVLIGRVDTEQAEVVKGLLPDDIIVVNGQINLKDGSQVSILNH